MSIAEATITTIKPHHLDLEDEGPEEAVDLAPVDRIVREAGRGPSALIPILHALQEHYNYLPRAALRRVSQITELTPATVAGVATFYSQFRLKPAGKHIIRVCHGTACHVKGSELVEDALRRFLAIAPGRDTDAAGQFTVERVGCLGCCTLAPVLQVGTVTYGHRAPDSAAEAVKDYMEVLASGDGGGGQEEGDGGGPAATEIRIGVGSCCVAGGSMEVKHALERTVGRLGGDARVKSVGCVGMCHQTPLVEVCPSNGRAQLYTRVKADQAADIVRKHVKPRGLVRRLRAIWSRALDAMVEDEQEKPPVRYATDARDTPVCEFLGRQIHIATEFCGHLDPLDLDEYLRHEGYVALRRALEMTPEQIIDAMKASGLRGRGGAGFPTGQKWALVRAAADPVRYLICNGDEGDPGAFMDRMILESYPYRELEGMAIAALAVGATEGFLYIRHEYPLAVKRIKEAIARCEQRGFLGDNLLGSGKSLRLKVVQGAGAFVCGEETALIASIEGRRGFPTLKPPYPAEHGLWGKPTLINNVETYAMVPWIIRRGGEAFAAMGTAKSKGTKVFALTGKINRGGLIEVPMGITMRQIVEEIGGGVAPGRRFKAVQIGGPSGGCIPASMADMSVDYESLTAAGAIMGSGGLVVLDDSDCMVDIARYFLSFTQAESCGQCTYCRVGTKMMLEILESICAGKARPGDLARLEELSGLTKQGSICGLGQTAPNPVLSTLRYFRSEYEAHLAGRCPAGRCKALIQYRVLENCIGCTRCAQDCPAGAIEMVPYRRHEIDTAKCTRCDVCRLVCPEKAIEVV